MKTKLNLFFILFFGMMMMQAQTKTTVIANSVDISDNLDLRAMATIFGESSTLEDFERRLNDPEIQLSNLDLNNDNQVDYLRVIESVENRSHLIIIQAVLGRDLFQDVATIEVERGQNNKLQVQIVGDVYMYGANYIYEPSYHYTPVIYNTFWVNYYRPYYSPWYWNYYPTFYYAWNPYPYFRYHSHINYYVNYNNTCHYVNQRRNTYAIAMHQTYRANGYERMHPNRSFQNRNNGYQNRHDLVRTDNSTRAQVASTTPRPTRANAYSSSTTSGTRNPIINTTNNSPRPRTENPRNSAIVDESPQPRAQSPRGNTTNLETVYNAPKPRQQAPKNEFIATNYPRETSSSQLSTNSPKPRKKKKKSDGGSSYSSPRSNPRSSQSQLESNQSVPSQPRVNSSNSTRVKRSQPESRSQTSSRQQTGGNSMRRG